MELVKVKKVVTDGPKKENELWEKQAPKPEEITTMLTDPKKSARIVDGEGNMIATILRGAMPKQDTVDYYTAIVGGKAIQQTNNRATSAGVDLINVVKKDGTISNTTKMEERVESSIIGYFDRYPRINYCRKTAWTLDNPDKWDTVASFVELVDDRFKTSCPDEWAIQNNITKKSSPDFKIGETIFTTITLNRNFRTFYHRDAGNLAEGFAAMSYMKTGKFTGGEICFPNYACGVKLYNYDLIIFKNTELHGNLEITPASKDSKYQRITSVFFFRQNMLACGTAEDELERAKRNKGDQIIGSPSEDLNLGRWGND